MATEPTDTDLSEQIAKAAKFKQVEGDEATVTMHSLPDLIEADKYLAKKRQGVQRGPIFFRQIPPGTRS